MSTQILTATQERAAQQRAELAVLLSDRGIHPGDHIASHVQDDLRTRLSLTRQQFHRAIEVLIIESGRRPTVKESRRLAARDAAADRARVGWSA